LLENLEPLCRLLGFQPQTAAACSRPLWATATGRNEDRAFVATADNQAV
jgi:hypothetical protein